MELEGLDYNTQREKLKLMAYGREIQQMVDCACQLPEKEDRQKAAETIIEAMKRVANSQQSYKERIPTLWYHLALMSNFKLDVDYPVEIVAEDKMATKPEPIPYSRGDRFPRQYGRLLTDMFQHLEQMPAGEERDALSRVCAYQMQRSLLIWGAAGVDSERIASDLARYTNGVVQMLPEELNLVAAAKKKRKK